MKHFKDIQNLSEFYNVNLKHPLINIIKYEDAKNENFVKKEPITFDFYKISFVKNFNGFIKIGDTKFEEKNMSEPSFSDKVYAVVREIPEGKVSTYGAIAKAIGAARSARMVGWAMNGASKNSDVPAHRVVNRLGLLTGRHHFTPPEKMQISLENEGLEIVK